MDRVRVLADWAATYADPISVRKGDPVDLSGKRDEWDGHFWVWAKNAGGKEGWVPDRLIESRGGQDLAAMDFDARELGCRKGEVLTRLDQTHGWILCRADDSQQGWVPSRNLEDT